ncbi:MAG: helix-turn-helix domain-containing protein, partial [candidate division Zixibacteria bacterium]|nr:helix-turn-helix domain-containing protein [candidate division Zixibacteria bacterium]
MSDYRTVEPFPPGEYLRDELQERGWTQKDLAAIVGQPASVISSIINGKRPISLELAQKLSDSIGNSVHHWVKLETAYRLALKPQPDKVVARRAAIYGRYPVGEMKKRGWIKGSNNVDELEAQLCDFLGKNRI